MFTKKKQGDKNPSVIKKTFKWISNVVLILLVILVILSAYSMFRSKNNTNEIPSILGYKSMSVLSGSMRPMLKPGDMIIAKEVSPKDIKIDDVITFRVNEKTLVTHRVIDIVHKDNQVFFKTKGDANNVEDHSLIPTDRLVGKLVFNIPKGGYIANWVRSPLGLIILIILPIIFLLGGELKTIFAQIDEKEKKDKNLNPEDNMEI